MKLLKLCTHKRLLHSDFGVQILHFKCYEASAQLRMI